MRTVVLVVGASVLLCGCSKKNDEPTPARRTNADPAPAPVPAAASIDCNALLTAADIEKICGAADYQSSTDEIENVAQGRPCARSFADPTKRRYALGIQINDEKTPEGAAFSLDKVVEGHRRDTNIKPPGPVAVGERATLTLSDMFGQQTLMMIDAIQGRYMFVVSGSLMENHKTSPACTEPKLIELANLVASRLPR